MFLSSPIFPFMPLQFQFIIFIVCLLLWVGSFFLLKWVLFFFYFVLPFCFVLFLIVVPICLSFSVFFNCFKAYRALVIRGSVLLSSSSLLTLLLLLKSSLSSLLFKMAVGMGGRESLGSESRLLLFLSFVVSGWISSESASSSVS